MQIRLQGKQAQLIRTSYDKEKKRGVTKVVGHLDRYTDSEPSSELLALLTPGEIVQVAEWRAKRKVEKEDADKKFTAQYADSTIDRIIAGVPLMTPEAALKVWDKISALQKALKKHGHRRPRLIKEVEVDPRQTSIN
jgi:hypothetical protein